MELILYGKKLLVLDTYILYTPTYMHIHTCIEKDNAEIIIIGFHYVYSKKIFFLNT